MSAYHISQDFAAAKATRATMTSNITKAIQTCGCTDPDEFLQFLHDTFDYEVTEWKLRPDCTGTYMYWSWELFGLPYGTCADPELLSAFIDACTAAKIDGDRAGSLSINFTPETHREYVLAHFGDDEYAKNCGAIVEPYTQGIRVQNWKLVDMEAVGDYCVTSGKCARYILAPRGRIVFELAD